MKGLVNVRAVKLTTEYAFPALVDHVTRSPDVYLGQQSEGENTLSLCFKHSRLSEVADCITAWLLDAWLVEWLKQDLRQKIPASEWEDTEHLVLMSMHEVRSESNVIGDKSYSGWAKDTKAGLELLLETCESMSIEGFVRFRLHPLVDHFSDMIFEELNQLLLDREYEDSVEMLRLVLDSHPKGQQEIHVFCTSVQVWLTDPSGLMIHDEEVSNAAFHASDEEVNCEDLAMSILIARSPRTIVLHDLFPEAVWPSFSETLKRVFEDRVTRCGHCSTCRGLETSGSRSGDDSTHRHRLRPDS